MSLIVAVSGTLCAHRTAWACADPLVPNKGRGCNVDVSPSYVNQDGSNAFCFRELEIDVEVANVVGCGRIVGRT